MRPALPVTLAVGVVAAASIYFALATGDTGNDGALAPATPVSEAVAAAPTPGIARADTGVSSARPDPAVLRPAADELWSEDAAALRAELNDPGKRDP